MVYSKNITLIRGDSLEEMKKLESGSIPLIVFSPPYNIRTTTGGTAGKGKGWKNSDLFSKGYDGYHDKLPRHKYIAWQREILDECMRLLPENGVIFYNHRDRSQRGLIETPWPILDGFPVRQIIQWDRGSGHNFNQSYFVPVNEQVYMICKPKFKLAKGMQRKSTIWRIRPAFGNKHPAPFPEELVYNCISSTDYDTHHTVLDPFMGSGTTGKVSERMGRSFIGIEQSQKYYRGAMRDQMKNQITGARLF